MTTTAEVIAQYRPNGVTLEAWQHVAPLVREAVARSERPTLGSCHTAMSLVAHFLLWGATEGLPMDAETVFTPAVLERYTAVGMPNYKERSRSTRRATLRTIARAVTTTAPWEPKPESLPRDTMRRPLTSAEIDRWWEIANQQPSPQRIRTVRTFVALGLGAGLLPAEFLAVTADHVQRLYGLVVIRVTGERARTVPLRLRWAPAVLKLAEQHPEGPLVGPTGTSRNRINVLLNQIVRPVGMPALAIAQLRTTWMIDVLNSGVPLVEFMAAAGWTTGSRIGELVPYLHHREPGKSWPDIAGVHD